MSVDLREEAGGSILVVKMSGTLRKADYGRFVLKAEQLIKKRGKLRILCEVHNFDGWETRAEQEDEPDQRIYEFELKHFADVERLAFVGAEAWEQTWAAFCRPFGAAAIRYFDQSKAHEAREWIYSELSAHSGVELPP
jgi:hypothetical protein